MSKHTPGPWWIDWNVSRLDIFSSDAATLVATIRRFPLSEGIDETARANARLIAIAPEMYDYISSAASNGCADAQRLIAMIDKAAIKAVEEGRNE